MTDFKKFHTTFELQKFTNFDMAYECTFNKLVPWGEEFEKFMYDYIHWLIKNNKTIRKGVLGVNFPENYNWIGKLPKLSSKKGIESLKNCVNKDNIDHATKYVYSDNGTLIATNGHILAIIENKEKFPDKTLIDFKSKALASNQELKFPPYQSVIPVEKKAFYLANINNVADIVGYAVKLSDILINNVKLCINLNGKKLYFNPESFNTILSIFHGNGCYMFTIYDRDYSTTFNRGLYMASCDKCEALIMPINYDPGADDVHEDNIIVEIPSSLLIPITTNE